MNSHPPDDSSLTSRNLTGEARICGKCTGSGIEQSLQTFRLVHRNQRILNRDPAFFAELAQGAGNGFAGSAGHRGHLFVREQQRKAIAATLFVIGRLDVFADLVGQFQEQPAEPGGDGLGQRVEAYAARDPLICWC